MVTEGGETMGDDTMVSADDAREALAEDAALVREEWGWDDEFVRRLANTVIALWDRVQNGDDPAKDDTDEAHPAWWRGYNADKGELGHIASTAQAEARTARARVALIEAERDESRAKMHAAEAEVTRMRALMAGRTTPPTREEFDALAEIGATLRVRWPGGDDEIPTHGDYYWTAIATVPEGARWWAHGANGALIEWPKVTP